jgi:hypothetical protein
MSETEQLRHGSWRVFRPALILLGLAVIPQMLSLSLDLAGVIDNYYTGQFQSWRWYVVTWPFGVDLQCSSELEKQRCSWSCSRGCWRSTLDATPRIALPETKLSQELRSSKQERGRLPNSLEELGVKSDESGPVFYEKKSESRYVVWYGTSLGESTTYDSEVRRWDDEWR